MTIEVEGERGGKGDAEKCRERTSRKWRISPAIWADIYRLLFHQYVYRSSRRRKRTQTARLTPYSKTIWTSELPWHFRSKQSDVLFSMEPSFITKRTFFLECLGFLLVSDLNWFKLVNQCWRFWKLVLAETTVFLDEISFAITFSSRFISKKQMSIHH